MSGKTNRGFHWLITALIIAALMIGVGTAWAETLVMPDDLDVIGAEAFSGDISLDTVVLPDGIQRIEARAFAGSSVREINLPASLSYIAEDAFDSSALQTVSAVAGTYAYDWAVAHGYIYPETDASLFTYSKPSNGCVAVTGFVNGSEYPDSIVIPRKSPDGYDITSIANSAFSGKDLLTKVTIQSNVATIGREAFKNCVLLRSVTLSEGLQTIVGNDSYNYGAFSGCVKLTSITIPSTVTNIGGHSFYGCSLLRTLEIKTTGDHPLSIGNHAFVGTNLTGTLTIPARVSSIGNYAFDGTPFSVLTIEEGSNLSRIGEYAFRNCVRLSTVTIPGNVKTIGREAFKGCVLLRSLTLNEGLKSIEGNDSYNYGAFSGCIKLTSVTIPSTVTEIGGHAFYNCTLLSQIQLLGSSVDQMAIRNNAFNGTALKGRLTIPSKVNTIGVNSFKGTAITELVIEEGKYLSAIGNDAFVNCTALTRVTIPGNVKTIGQEAFMGCTALTSVNLSEGLESIGGNNSYNYGAFSGCTALPSIRIPTTVTSIGGHAFFDCSSLTSLNIPDGYDYEVSIGGSAFQGTALTGTLMLPSRVKGIGASAFRGTPITELIIEEGLYTYEISRYAFENCKSLTSISIPGNVKTIGQEAFMGCTALTSVNLSEGLESIGGNNSYNYGAFSGCTALPSVTIPTTVTSIGGHAFFGCSSLTSLNIPDSYDYEVSIGGSAFQGTALTGTLMLPSRVKGIGTSAFRGTPITELIIEEGLYTYEISRYAFENCKSLTSISIPGNVTTIGQEAFQGCTALKTVTLSEGLVTISGNNSYDYGAFSGCTTLTSVTIPSTVKTVAGHAFYNCQSLYSIVIRNSAGNVTIGSNAFKNCPGTPSYVN